MERGGSSPLSKTTTVRSNQKDREEQVRRVTTPDVTPSVVFAAGALQPLGLSDLGSHYSCTNTYLSLLS